METLKGLFMARVDAFLERTGVGPTTLGRQAVGDPNLVRELRHGRSPMLATVDQILAFMEGFDEAGVDPVSSRSDRLRDSSPRERRGREMTRTMVQEMEVPIRIVRLPAVQARTGLGRSTIYVRLADGARAEHDLRAAGRGVPQTRPARRARCRLDRGGGGRVDPQADRVEPRRGRVIGASQRETKEKTMQPLLRTVRAAAWAALWMLMPGVLWAQGTSPWVEAVNELQAQFTGPIARGLSLIAIVVGGLMFAFGEGGSKRTLAGIIFGLGMAMGAANFLAWLF